MIQSDDFNRSRIATVIALVITSNLKLAQAPGNVLLPSKVTGLGKDTAANISQVITIDKSFLTEKVGKIPSHLLRQVEDGIRLVMGLQATPRGGTGRIPIHLFG